MDNAKLRKLVRKRISGGKGGPGAPKIGTGDASGIPKNPPRTKGSPTSPYTLPTQGDTALTRPSKAGTDIGIRSKYPFRPPSVPLLPTSETDPRIPRSTGMVPRGWADSLRRIQGKK